MTENVDLRFEDYLSLFPGAVRAIDYANRGLTYIALSELNILRRSIPLKGTGIENFFYEAERVICREGIHTGLELAYIAARQKNREMVNYHIMQARDFATRMGVSINESIRAAMEPLKKK